MGRHRKPLMGPELLLGIVCVLVLAAVLVCTGYGKWWTL